MVAIRLTRFGHKKAPFYRIVATDSKKRQGGVFLEILGTWNPAKSELTAEKEKIAAWVAKGAQVSTSVKKLLTKKL
jgi:small subunit ribosomal protein S16